jgi:hypothetical protein
VADATKRFGFKFPIAVDSDRRVWRAFDAEAWPTKYLIDKDGKVALVHQGEGDYAAFENEIQELLKEANPKLEFTASQFQDIPPEPRFGNVCRQPTPEIYLGAERGTLLANDAGYKPLTAAVYQLPHEIPPDRYALSGRWLAAPEYIQHVSKGADDYLRLSYRAKAVYIVAGSDDGKPKNISIAQDGKPIAEDARGVDVKADSKGGTYVSLSGKRMYYLVNNPKFEEHQLEIRAEEPSLSLYSFTFGNECENAFEHK